MIYDVTVIGGGAAGFFAALAAKAKKPEANVLILEKSAVLLAKVRISGGGRCNVTHHCFDPRALVNNYPRGHKELLGPFHHFQPLNTMAWFESRGIPLKIESDGRIFPVTDSSQSIIDCLLSEAKKLGVEIALKAKILSMVKQETFVIALKEGTVSTRCVILATGNSQDGYLLAKEFGHSIESPVPSLFTFNIPSFPLKDLSGISLPSVELTIPGTSLREKGALLITHFGLSGPAVLKLSAWGARTFHEKNYHFPVTINWVPDFSKEDLYLQLISLKKTHPQHLLSCENLFSLPKNLWKALTLPFNKKLGNISLEECRALAEKLHQDSYHIEGKTTHKEEFVTCGGIALSEVNFKTMESKICKGLFFAGEVLDIDGITGGFNFQNAWTTGYLAGTACSKVEDLHRFL